MVVPPYTSLGASLPVVMPTYVPILKPHALMMKVSRTQQVSQMAELSPKQHLVQTAYVSYPP